MAVALRSDRCSPNEHQPNDAGRLFELYSGRILAYCLHTLRSRTEAEDAVQTTFLYAHRALQRGVLPESEYAWLHGIAKNVCRWQQRTKARRSRLSSATPIDDLADVMPLHEHEDDLSFDIRRALAEVPDRQRRALLLREWRGLSSGEVATSMGLSSTETYALLTRARRSFARALTVVRDRPVLSLDFGSLLFKLRGLLTAGTAKLAATTAVVAGIAVGGVAIERSIVDRGDSRPVPDAGVSHVGAPNVQRVPEGASAAKSTARSGSVSPARRTRERSPGTRWTGGNRYAPAGTDGWSPIPGGTVDTQPEATTAGGGSDAPTAIDLVPEPSVPSVDVQLPPPPLELPLPEDGVPDLPVVGEQEDPLDITPPATSPLPPAPDLPPVPGLA